MIRSIVNGFSTSCQNQLLKILMIASLVIIAVSVVYFTGGTRMVYVHLLYIPILLSALFWAWPGGLLIGIISGIAVGPFMPLDVSEGIMQEPLNWISRVAAFSTIGLFTGYILSRVHKLNREAEDKAFISPFYNLPNTNQLVLDLEQSTIAKTDFNIISIKLTNLDSIEKYVDHNVLLELVQTLARDIDPGCERQALYSYGKDELIVVAYADRMEDYKTQIKKVIRYYYSHPISINGYSLRLSLKVGIFEYRGEDLSPEDIYNKARIAHEQGEEKESGLYFYDEHLEKQRRQMQDMTGALLESIRQNELYVLYQPKIDLVNEKVCGAEALVRWNKNGNDFVSPNYFIPVAEEIGFINEITKFVMDDATTHLKRWEEKGIQIDCAINVSVKELVNNKMISRGNSLTMNKGLEKSKIEIEITERSVAFDDTMLIQTLNQMKKEGYQISLDDFGTGYNSLLSIGEIPFDILKIDKYFIDRIDRFEIGQLVRHIIDLAHSMGKKVIAEGVETKDQLTLLKNMKCDHVQGYYFSKPLLPDEFESYCYSLE